MHRLDVLGSAVTVRALQQPQSRLVTVHAGDKLVVEEIPEVVHLEEVGVMAEFGAVVVLGDLGPVLHVDLEAELLFGGGVVGLVVGDLPLLPLLHDELEERDGLDGGEDGGQDRQPEQRRFHLFRIISLFLLKREKMKKRS